MDNQFFTVSGRAVTKQESVIYRNNVMHHKIYRRTVQQIQVCIIREDTSSGKIHQVHPAAS